MLWNSPVSWRPGEALINPWSYQSLGVELWNAMTAPTSQNYIAVGVVVFIPFVIPEPMTITKLWWANGSAVAGNIDAGVYEPDGTRVVSTGTTLQATISDLQVVDVTDATIERGLHYLAIVSDTSGATQKIDASLPAAGIAQSFGLLEQAGVTLPLSTGASPATFAKYTRAYVPRVGLQGYRTFGP